LQENLDKVVEFYKMGSVIYALQVLLNLSVRGD